MDNLIYGFTIEEWNSFSAEEQLSIQDREEYLLLHKDEV